MSQSMPTEEFLITDPEAQPGVILSVEAGVRPVELLEPYDANHDVRCAFCKHRQAHKKGYLALLPDGHLALCGNVCAEEFFGKQKVNSLDQKREVLADARLRRELAEAIVGKAGDFLPFIVEQISPNESRAEAAMKVLGRHLNRDVRERIKGSDVLGVEFLGQDCRAFREARGGIARIVGKASGVTQRDVEKLMETRAQVVQRIGYGTQYLREAVAFFQPDNLHRFRDWLLANQSLHNVRAVDLSSKRRMILRLQNGKTPDGSLHCESCQVEVPTIEAPDCEAIMATLGWQACGRTDP